MDTNLRPFCISSPVEQSFYGKTPQQPEIRKLYQDSTL